VLLRSRGRHDDGGKEPRKMQRRKAITVAAGASLTLLAGAGGMALNAGIGGAGSHDQVGTLTPVSAELLTPAPDGVAGTTAPTAVGPAVRPTTTPPVTTSSGSSIAGTHHDEDGDDDHADDHDADDDHVDGEHRDRSHDGEHEYEGADDDD
jgi:hypothetical protein